MPRAGDTSLHWGPVIRVRTILASRRAPLLAAAFVAAGGPLAVAAADEPPAAEGAPAPAPGGDASGAPSASVPAPAPPRAPDFTPPPVQPFTPPAQEAPAPSTAPAAAEVRDAHADRVVLLPTAYTHPAGALYISDYDIVLLQIGYAFTDSTQVSLTASPPLEGQIVALDVSLKTVIARDGLVRLAGIGSVSGLWGADQGNFALGRVGAVTELCFEETCRSSASIAADFLLAGPDTIAMTGVGLVWRVASWAALLFEVDSLVPLSRDAGRINGIGVAPGIRLPHRTWSFDLALGSPLGVRGASAVPLLAFTYRYLP
jgi:hypothetical protein